MTEKKERGQKEKKNRGCSACSSNGLAGWFVCLFSLWRWWELSIGHCQFSPHWENIHVDSWNPESRVKQTRGQQIQDSARMKHISKSKSPAKAPSALSSSLKCMVDNWRNHFYNKPAVLFSYSKCCVRSEAELHPKEITKLQRNTESKWFKSLKTTEGFN